MAIAHQPRSSLSPPPPHLRRSYRPHHPGISISEVVDPFCLRQFNGEKEPKVDMTVEAFEQEGAHLLGYGVLDGDRRGLLSRKHEARTTTHVQPPPIGAVNSLYQAAGGEAALVDGYAPFCKHVFVKNFAGVKSTTLAITSENEHLLRSGYEARTDKELPVLGRWFPSDLVGEVPDAEYLDIILYSREQIRKENAAMGEDSGSDAPWGIVSIKPQGVDYELPMQPITGKRWKCCDCSQ